MVGLADEEAPNPNAFAETFPLVTIVGINNPYANLVCEAKTV